MNFVTPIGGYYEMLQEEQPPFFFQGYLHEYTWAYGGSRLLLVPGFLKTTELNFGGKNNWYLQVPWSFGMCSRSNATPRRSHPFGKRVFALDQQTYTPLMILTYNTEGALFGLCSRRIRTQRLTQGVTAFRYPSLSVHHGSTM